jgi:hypothetical protein
MVTWQEEGRGGMLIERRGIVELKFRLSAADGGLVYRQEAARLRVGPIRVPVARWASPRVGATERPCGDGGRVAVEVSVALPLFGEWLRYSGWIAPEEE